MLGMRFACLVLLIITVPVHATDPIPLAKSGPERVSLVELFTSEGCSSCPPADQWFSKQVKNKTLWKSFVPVAFHVDYWDNLGWKDQFSSKAATTRQRAIARNWKAPAVYTPGFVINGIEWQNWRMSTTPPAPAGRAGILKLARVSKASESFTLVFEPTAANKSERFVVHMAVLGIGLKSQVRGGENSGAKFHHDFVVLDWKTNEAARSKDLVTSEFSLKIPPDQKTAVVGWVESPDQFVPLQAAGAFL